MRINVIFSLIVLIVFCSCRSGNEFTQRKYLKGNYKSNSVSIGSHYKTRNLNNTLNIQEPDNSLALKTNAIFSEMKFVKLDEVLVFLNDKKDIVNTIKATQLTNNNSLHNEIVKTERNSINIASRDSISSKEKMSIRKNAKKSVIFSGIAYLLEIAGLVGVLSLGIYAFVVFIIAGIVFGIKGAVLGGESIRGGKKADDRTSKILGVIGLISGLIAIVFGLGSLLYLLVENITIDIPLAI